MEAIRTWLAASCAAALLCPSVPAQVCGTSGPNVITGDVGASGNYAIDEGGSGLDSVAFGTAICNVGDTAVPVVASTNEHYLAAQHLYRYKDMGGWFAFEQVGLSWIRHGFAALAQSLCCTCTPPGTVAELGAGCSDVLSAGLNGQGTMLRPRWQVNAFTGDFVFPGSNPPITTQSARRLEIDPADLEGTASGTTRYFAEIQHIDPADSAAGQQDDNASYRELNVFPSSDDFNLFVTGATERGSSALRAWRDVDPSVQVQDVRVPGEGLLELAWKVTDLGDGTWHYEYALHNLNSHDSVRGFSLPLPAGVAALAPGFHDVQYRNGDGEGDVDRDGTDWAFDDAGGAASWSTSTFAADANANALRWGTTYNFRFDAGVPPTTGTLTLELYRSGGTLLVPGVEMPGSASPFGTAFCNASDGALDLCPCANPGGPQSGCDLAQGTGGVLLSVPTFAPDGVGGGTATLLGEGFPTGASPTVIAIRSPGRAEPPVAFGDGLRCLAPAGLVRIATSFATNGSSGIGIVHGAGAGAGTFGYQVWARNQPAAFCTPQAFNLSNAVELTW